MMSQEPNSSPSRLSDDALAKMIFETRTTIRKIPRSSAEVADRLSRFNELYEALPTKPDTAALLYRDPLAGSPTWSAIGNRLSIGRSPKRVGNACGSVLPIEDQEMSRQHFEIVLTSDGIYLLNDLNSLNGTYVDGVRQKTAVLIGGSEIRAGKYKFRFHRSVNSHTRVGKVAVRCSGIPSARISESPAYGVRGASESSESGIA